MSDHLENIITNLETSLKEVVPETWRVVDAESLGTSKTTGIVLTYEPGNLVTEIAGSGLPRGSIAMEFVLVLSAPETDATKGTKRVTSAAVDLCLGLDSLEDLAWTTGERLRLETGETAYRFPIVVLSFYTPTPEEE